ncbi:pyridoxal phosphate-dependent decarboxylase family protein [Duganella qianjiadongensis]|uniref:Pyridoxal-dependent decarboxylase n=1 Tax=Duganella qianjiadongensis TaxID=2692176 RepID=A0ABW9VMV1_9BURK|nr:pyridoxal-dependent decarboxylase [Duganella qianjiadongensis]MYM39758.1 hypothetical protein [Duganella qianjiadongensis]
MLAQTLSAETPRWPAAVVTALPDLTALGGSLRRLTGFDHHGSTDYFPSISQAHLHAIGLAQARIARCAAINRQRLVAYTSDMAHGSVAVAFELAGYDSAALRQIATDGAGRLRCDLLQTAIRADREAGLEPFLICAAAGNSENGTIDALGRLAAIARDEGLWLHLDASYGALARLAGDLAPLLAGMELADTLAFDLYRWGLQPYATAILLGREITAPSAAAPSSVDAGAQLAIGLRALVQWQQQAPAPARLGRDISRCCALARRLGMAVQQQPALELLLPVTLNVVCLRYLGDQPDAINQAIVALLQNSRFGISSCRVRRQQAIRVVVQDASQTPEQIEHLVAALLAAGQQQRRQRVAASPRTLTA